MLMYFIHIINILVNNDVNKIHQKINLNICFLCLKFFPAIRCYYSDWLLLFFIQKCFVTVVRLGSTFVFVPVPLFLFLYQGYTLQRVE